MKISAGRLDRRAILLRPDPTTSAMGAPVTAYTAVEARWCERLKFVPSVLARDPQRQAVAAIDLLFRLDALTTLITTEWRLRMDGADMVIIGVNTEPVDGSVIVTCTAPKR